MPIAQPRHTLWCLVATQKSDQQMADAFNRIHHGLRIEVTAVPDAQFVTKIATAIRSGNVPDAVDLDDVNATLLAYRDALTDLTPSGP
ncbi:extracellular solute-binding protein [Streptomyces sp. NPDC003996]